MANTVKLKRSSIQGKIPLVTDLALGELAINTYDGKLYLKKNVGGTESIVDISSGLSATEILTLLKTVDGSGSGLDADLLDGLNSSSSSLASTVMTRDANSQTSIAAINFDSVSAVEGAAGRLWYDTTTDQLNFSHDGIVTQQIGEELYVYVKASATITEGQLVVTTGAVGQSGTITAAPAGSNLTSSDTIIGVATQSIALGEFGRVTKFGIVRGLNTTGQAVGETWAAGDTLYYNPTGNGTLTKTKPVSPSTKCVVATVINPHQSTGSLQISIQLGSTLGGTDSNVEFSTLDNNDLLVYNSTASRWENKNTSTITAGNSTQLNGQNSSYYLDTSSTAQTKSGTLNLTDSTLALSVKSKIKFVSPDSTKTISSTMYDNGILSYDGTSGQLFSISDSMSGTIYSVNDVSGIPSIEVLDTGLIKFAQYSGNVLIGSGTDNGTDKLQVTGSATVSGNTILGGTLGSQTVQINTTTNTGQYFDFDRINGSNTQIIKAVNSNFALATTGAGALTVYTSSTLPQFQVSHTASAVNYVSITGAVAGSGPTLSAQGSDTNIDLALTPKGSGIVKVNSGITALGRTNLGNLSDNSTFTTLASRSLNLISDDAVLRVARTTTYGNPAVELIGVNPTTGAINDWWDFYTNSDTFYIRRRTVGETVLLAASSTGVSFPNGDVSVSNNLTVTGDLTVNGTTTTINTATLTVDDKNIELGSVTTPTDVTADGGGITLKGTTDKTILWNATNGWVYNQPIKFDMVGPMTGINMSNNDIIGVNALVFADPGNEAYITWSGGNGWKILESSNNIDNTAGNLQFLLNSTRIGTFNTSGQLELPVATGTAPLLINSSTLVSNLNADLLDGQHGSYYAATTHKYHEFTPDTYYFDNYEQRRFLRVFTENSVSDTVRFCPISNVEYYDFNASAWTAWTGGETVIKNLLDGRQETYAEIDHAHRRFRFTVNKNTGYPTFSLVAMYMSWWGNAWTDIGLTIEDTTDQVNWTTKNTLSFGASTTDDDYGWHAFYTNSMHNGRTINRFTFDIADWVDQPYYTTKRIYSLSLFSNYANASGTVGVPITWDYDRVIRVNNNKIWHEGNDGSGSGLDADLLDGQNGSYYTSAANLSGTIPSTVLGNSSVYIGTTAVTLNRASANISLTGTSIDGNAGTATKLETARTINGVSFDGSANITIPTNIANSVTFNNSGTGDASGTTFDGSVAKTVSYNTIGAVGAISQAGSGLDFNTIYPANPTFYRVYWNTGDANMVNSPDSNSSGFLFSSQGSHNLWNGQFFLEQGATGDLFIRGSSDAGGVRSWGNWRKVWHNENDGSGSGLDADLLDGQQGSYYAADSVVVKTSGDQTISGTKTFSNPELRIGNSDTANYISFRGTTGDGPGNFTHTYIGEYLYGSTESAELLLYKGNDVEGASGPDRIRHIAANHVFQTYTTAFSGTFATIAASATPVTRLIVRQDGKVGVGIDNPSTIFETEENTTGTTSITITNSSTANNVTKSARLRFRLTDSVGTRKDAAYITAYPYNFDSSTGDYLSFATRTADSNPTEKARLDNNGNFVLGSSFTATGTASQPLQVNGGAYVSGNVGVGVINPSYKLEVNGSFAATTKSFVIDHPTKEGKRLRYGSLEGPENGVYVRGKLVGTNTIELPEYWTKLVDPDSITVQLTPIGKHQKLYVEDIIDNKVIVGNENLFGDIKCFYVVFAERCDVDKLEVEIDGN